MTSVLVDLRHALRVHARNPGTTAIAAFTLALAIGATTAIFSVVYGVLLRPLPFPDSDRLMAIWEVNHRGTYARLADPNFADFRDRNRTFSAMAKFTAYVIPVVGAAEPVRTTVATVSKDFFTVLGVQPARGRGIAADDARMGAEPVAIVSHRFWVQWMNSTASFSTFHLKVEDRVHTVVGVMPAGFQFPANVDVWRPAELSEENTSRTAHNYQGIGRLRGEVSVARAAADISGLAKDIVRNSPEKNDYLMVDATVLPLQASLTRRVGSTLYVLLGAVCFLLLVACANVTNLLLAQAAARQRELAIRHALGAGPGRLVRLFVAEAVVLLTVSCLAGLLIAWLGTRALLSLAPANLPRLDDVSMNGTVLAFAMGLSALVGLVLGLLTAARAARRDARDALVDGGRGQTGASSQRVGRMIVTVQMAMTVVLLIGATLLGRSLLRVLSVDPGFRTDGIVAMDVTLPDAGPGARAGAGAGKAAAADADAGADADAAYRAEKARLGLVYADLFDRLGAIPGVEQVAAANAVPLDGGLPDGMFLVIAPHDVPKNMEDVGARFRRKEGLGTADYSAVSPRYFQTLGIPLRRGRLFDDRDGAAAPHVAVINEALARARWRDSDPIGATIEFGNMDGDIRPITIVGIVGDTRVYGLEQPARPTMYVNLMQRPRSSATVVMRTALDPQGVITAARRVLKETAPDVPPRFRTFEQIYTASLGDRHFNLTLVTTFAATALALAIAGIYGIMSYTVAQRRREIGVRVAVGATQGQVFRLIVGQALTTTSIGVVLGLMAALGLTRTVERLLFGITPTDPVTFAIVIATLTAAAILACYLPARRATRLDPIAALRDD